MSYIKNVIVLADWVTKIGKQEKFKKHHHHCVFIKAYDNLYKRQLKAGEDFKKLG